MNALFICDNKEQWEIFTKMFLAHFPKVKLSCVLNSSNAFERISSGEVFSFYILDISLKSENPLDIVRSMIDLCGEIPAVYMGPADQIKLKINEDLYSPGANLEQELHMPLDVEQFKQVITQALNRLERDQFEDSVIEMGEDECLPIKVKNFYLFDYVPYNVYMRITKTKYGKVIYADRPYHHSIIQKYVKKQVRHFYLLKEDHIKFLENSAEECVKALNENRDDLEKSYEMQINGASIFNQYIKTIGVTEKLSILAKEIVNSCSYTFNKVKKIMKVLEEIPFNKKEVADQSILKFYFCMQMLNAMGWRSDITKNKLGLVALLHDCYLSNEAMNTIGSVNDPNLRLFNLVEQGEFVEHPEKAASVAEHFGEFPDCQFIIRQHHELPEGDGFPAGINHHKITALTAIFIIASNVVAEFGKWDISNETIVKVKQKFAKAYDIGNFKKPLDKLMESLDVAP